jgi:hypothetical protein
MIAGQVCWCSLQSSHQYASPTAIYINYDGTWLKWNIERSWDSGRTEHYMGRGDIGRISALITSNNRAPFDALATGNGIHFKGKAKYYDLIRENGKMMQALKD